MLSFTDCRWCLLPRLALNLADGPFEREPFIGKLRVR